MEILLHALTVSQSAHLALTAYKRKLYKAYDCVSAMAFPPLIPLYWSSSDSPLPKPYITAFKQGMAINREPILNSNSWYLPLEEPGLIRSVQNSMPETISGLFPISEGIYIGEKEETTELIPLDSPCRISDLWITTMRITVSSEISWWEDLFISTLEEHHLRG